MEKTYKICEEMISPTATQANALAVIGKIMCLGYKGAYGREISEQDDNEEQVIEEIIPPFSNDEWKEAINRALYGIY